MTGADVPATVTGTGGVKIVEAVVVGALIVGALVVGASVVVASVVVGAFIVIGAAADAIVVVVATVPEVVAVMKAVGGSDLGEDPELQAETTSADSQASLLLGLGRWSIWHDWIRVCLGRDGQR